MPFLLLFQKLYLHTCLNQLDTFIPNLSFPLATRMVLSLIFHICIISIVGSRIYLEQENTVSGFIQLLLWICLDSNPSWMACVEIWREARGLHHYDTVVCDNISYAYICKNQRLSGNCCKSGAWIVFGM
jgi:hypothetical protein